ncbi:MAG: Trehalose synthase [Methanobacterium sp. PtaU1.Bin097]|nr:MAG: Trehalose synthase [Methanobacterium sp. PtaU1.Bin097]
MPKKIAFVDLLFNYPPDGGSWVDEYEIASRLQKHGHDICLFLPDFTRYTNRGVIKVSLPFQVKHINFSRYSFNRYSVPERFMKALEEYNPDYVVICDGYFLKPFLVNRIAQKYKVILRFYAYEIICGMNNHFQPQLKRNCNWNIFKNPFICWGCVNWNLRTPTNFIKLFFEFNLYPLQMHFAQEYLASMAFFPDYPSKVKKALKAAHQIIVYNQHLADIIRPYNQHIQITPSGIDINRFQPKENYANPGIKKILLSGRINDPVKGLNVVRDALRELWKKRQDFQLLITTDHSFFVTEPFMQKTGWLKPEELPELYRSCDISLVPSYWREAFGITALESMASGLPVIASDTGGLHHTIENGLSGIHVTPGDPKMLQNKIEELLDNESLRIQLGKNARKRVESLYNWDSIVEQYYVPLFES